MEAVFNFFWGGGFIDCFGNGSTYDDFVVYADGGWREPGDCNNCCGDDGGCGVSADKNGKQGGGSGDKGKKIYSDGTFANTSIP